MPAVSVLMPVFNTNIAHLKAAIDSILMQTLHNFELIVLNDSPANQNIATFVKSYRDDRIKYFENPKNLGIANSYNRLVQLAGAEYCAMMNHDDISLPLRLQKQYDYLQSHIDIGLVGSAYKKFGEINRFKVIQNPSDDAHIKSLILFKAPILHPTIMFRKSVAQKYNISYNPDFISLNDRQFFHDFGKVSRLENLRDTLYKYRFHKNMVSKMHKKQIINEQKVFHQMWFDNFGIELLPQEKEIFDNFITNGRCRIKDKDVLASIKYILEKLVTENQARRFLPQREFAEVCSQYFIKRCFSAAVYGHICSEEMLRNTSLPVSSNFWLNCLNLTLHWNF